MANIGLEIAECLARTISPDVNIRKAAEQRLLDLQNTVPSFAIHVLTNVENASLTLEQRIGAAVLFKNYVRKAWTPKDDITAPAIPLAEGDRNTIKVNIVSLMLNSPDVILKQLMEAISIISETDYPAKWETLLPELLQKLSSPDRKTINGILNTVHSIFKKYRRSLGNDNEIIKEIIYSVNLFALPLLERTKV